MNAGELLAALLAVPDETPCEVTVGRGTYTVGDLKAAASREGPKMLTTKQAAARYGWTPGYWRDVAKAAGVPKDRMWRLPVAVCERHMREKKTRRRIRKPWAARVAD